MNSKINQIQWTRRTRTLSTTKKLHIYCFDDSAQKNDLIQHFIDHHLFRDIWRSIFWEKKIYSTESTALIVTQKFVYFCLFLKYSFEMYIYVRTS